MSRPSSAEQRARLPARRLAPDDKPLFRVGEVAPHPWQLEPAAPLSLTLGPGEVVVEQTRVFEPHQTVTIAAGTHLRMGPRASLIFLGKVLFAGQQGQPIVVDSLGARRWGGIAIQGPRTAGSRLEHVLISGGTRPAWRSIPYPAMLDIHHTRDIVLADSHIGENAPETDAIHVAYVTGLRVTDTALTQTAGDGLDLELSDADVRRARLINIGDDGLDLMGSQVKLSDSMILGAQGNGISGGEESVVKVHNTLVADCRVGVLAKNAAKISLSGSVLYGNETGVRTYQRTVRYAGESEVTADVLFVAESRKKPVNRGDRDSDRLDRGRVLLDLPQPGVLDHVLEDVLELQGWQALAGWIKDQRQEVVR